MPWNTVILDGPVPSEGIEDMIDHCYRQVVAASPTTTRVRLLGY
ncbi:MAG TPA: hypothetical protein VGM75_30805 [Pseudonocardiaceae bacterium]